ncbi:hypothetical protein [Anaeromyxobacter diazotrophicus]|uniref:Uncharacterized protein n=1 Tax=Anaeromyxobacter diazotrophicus TaxID=2590199 RepID=A0A7I9VGM7_9BACT|nr:hypothetical protein [Anaeromyxobacter diazotrophicus]GEJ55399.1 hypothetical protein AMYX_01400 [Anaeromyxobacter diazotrophicus]
MPEPAPTVRRRAVEWALHLAGAYAAWLAFTQRLAPSELAVGAGAALLAAVASRLVWSRNGATFAGAGRWLLAGWQVAPYAFTGTVEILRVLARQLGGRPAPSLLLAVRFDAGGPGPREQARRALAVAYTTMTPNFIVLGVDAERGLLWFHQLERSEVPDMTRRLGARP